ncbi:Probable endo-beta-1,4-glucanase D Short=Endoglucanase D; AltName: Full=Carboxymethylcellulase D; AltName: Full=Cellulase D; Flags: Precursor [Serendipita indica DSM 11827]|uniref:AA9 family lytic polysaccharide monooxygenase n=1 Tax=Serendipita indica (strain DSM 11827) TaxID=1109443 RepID=G4T8M6_SERID|nr:Probable endo-beta-1,4-glucanase D Short=Endoglucanase D; AltName: Full=Carboxymethylcellulase D; AltName: Full=Cellulase D; Flags: Precursor [Serendipita indica DSM 11827]CCA67659.1 related to endoglucanase B [Serendipita indica DSM 11827]
MISPLYLLSALSVAGSAFGHTIFTRLYVNGVDQGHLTGIRYPTYDGPITDVTSNDLICNGGPNPLTTPYPSTVIPVPAGAQLTAEWHHTLTSTPETDAEDPVAKGHNGPIMAYLAKVPDATQTTVTGLGWFKIYEDGLSGGTWAVEKLIANKGKVSFTVPSCIPPGDYFLRMELIALHAASSYPGAQFYMECAQIRITGGGSASPATYSIPGIYAGSDPGITINLYYPPVTSYTIPGPRPFTCSGSNSSTAQSSTVSSSSRSSTSTRASSSSSSSTSTRASSSSTRASSTSSAATGTQTLYGQCGGQGWTGPTTCASGTCKVSNQFYSQCLP